MTKTSERNLVAAIADSFNTYVGKGVRLKPLLEAIDPNLSINDLNRLLRIHFALTEQEGDRPGVIDFVEVFPMRLRQLKTTVSHSSGETPIFYSLGNFVFDKGATGG